MHFTLADLFCSLISVSIGAGDGPDDAPQDINVHAAAWGEVTALKAGQIIAVKPNDVLYDGWQNAKLHPAVFVDIKYIDKRPLVQVVMMSTSFKIQNVPPHLRGSVDDYFPGVNTFNALGMERKLRGGQLDFSRYRHLHWENNIFIDNEGKPTIMKQVDFTMMKAVISSNMACMGIMPFIPKHMRTKELTSEPGLRDSVQEGEIVRIKIEIRKLQTPPQPIKFYPAIFVCWTGDRKLAIVPISGGYIKETKTAKIDDYGFIRKRQLHGEISLDNYDIVHLESVKFDRLQEKTIMIDESFEKLRDAIDSNIKARARGEHRN